MICFLLVMTVMVVTHSQETCTSFLHQIFVQVHASSADGT